MDGAIDGAVQSETEVLIVGAGPTGLVLALWLARMGVRIRILDKTAEPGTTSRALVVQVRTLEFYRQLGFADEVVASGRWAKAANLWVEGRQRAHIDFGEMGAGLSPFASPLIYPQDDHEGLLVEQLAKAGVEVERSTELTGFESTDGGVTARIRRADGSEESCRAAYLAGCDGARSIVRERLGIGFAGGTYEHLFYVADVAASGPAVNGELHIGLDTNDFLVVFPLRGEGTARLVGTVREQQQGQEVTWKDVGQGVIERLRIEVERVNWFSTYRVHHRVAAQFRRGRVFLLGDAAHIHSPVGGQGMNTGIGDAVNLAWKLAAVLQGRGAAALLDSYEPERIAFARRLVKTTDQAFTGVTSAGWLARLLRLRVAPLVLPRLFSWGWMRRYLFRTVAQLEVNYRESSLSEGRAGRVRGGDRLPWVKLDGEDNFAPLRSLDWLVHVYGAAGAELREACAQARLPLCEFAWQKAMRRAGLRRGAAYLVRPDGYVALAEASGRAAAVAAYLEARGLHARE